MSLSLRMFDDVGRSIKSRRLRALALGALAAVILLLIASTSFVAYLAAPAPVVASYLAPNHPTVLMELAERALKEMADPTLPTSFKSGLDAPGRSPGPGVAPTDSIDGRDPPPASINESKASSDRKHETGAPDDKKKPVNSKQPKETEWLAKRREARGLAERALVHSPLEARAFRLLGDVAPEGYEEAFMRAALSRSQIEIRAAYSL